MLFKVKIFQDEISEENADEVTVEANSQEEAKDKAFAILCPWVGNDLESGAGYYWKAEVIR